MTKNYIESIENFGINFDKIKDNQVFCNEQIIEIKEEDKIYINFRECFVAISPNGGLIGICKKKGFLDITKGSKLNEYIIIMHQNFRKKYYIHIDWEYKQTYFILFDFNEKEQLYGICNDGSIYKMDILKQKAVQKISSEIFKNENIEKAKLYEEGFMALTKWGNFYFIKDIKNPIPELFIQMKSLLHFSNKIDFLIIPASVSRSGKIELLINNEKGHGVIHIEKMDEARFFILPLNENSDLFYYKGISIIKKDKLEPFILRQENINDISSLDKNSKDNQYFHENLRKIATFAISPSKKNIALYDTRGHVFFFDSTLDICKFPRQKAEIKINEGLPQNEIIEYQMVMNYEDGFQFSFCGEDSVILVGLRLIFLLHKSNHITIYRITEYNENDALKGKLFCKCISEIDGVRYLTNDGIYFISQVCQEFVDISDPFSKSYSKKLLQSFQSHLNKSADCEILLREIGKNLNIAINSLLLAAGNIFWVGESPDGGLNLDKKDLQLFILRAAQYGKYFVDKDDFNFDKFLEMCKYIRCVNNLRNHSTMPKLITLKEFQSMDPKDLIQKLMRNLNFGMAFEICHFLGYKDKKIYQRYAISKIKKSNKIGNEEEERVFNYLDEKLKEVPHLSFIKLAKKAFKYHKNIIGMKFLEKEKSALSKIPQYIELEQWDEALNIAENLYDYKVINTLLYKIFKKQTIKEFISTVSLHPKVKSATIEFLKNNYSDQIENYLTYNKNPDELVFFYLEKFFQTPDISERKKYISLAKENLKLIDYNINPNFELKFYKNFIDSLENNLNFKIDSQSKGFIINPDEISFDISIYDFYKLGLKEVINEKNNYIETYNKSFGFSQEGMNIIKFIVYGEEKRFVEIDEVIKKANNNIKKLSLTNLNIAEIFYQFKKYDKAVEYIKNIKEPKYLNYKIEMLEYINKFESALEIIISDKTITNMNDLVNDILKKKPELQTKVEELCTKYKVIFK